MKWTIDLNHKESFSLVTWSWTGRQFTWSYLWFFSFVLACSFPCAEEWGRYSLQWPYIVQMKREHKSHEQDGPEKTELYSHSKVSPLRIQGDLYLLPHQAYGKERAVKRFRRGVWKGVIQKDRNFSFVFLLKTRHPLGLLVYLGVFAPELFLPGMKMGASGARQPGVGGLCSLQGPFRIISRGLSAWITSTWGILGGFPG